MVAVVIVGSVTTEQWFAVEQCANGGCSSREIGVEVGANKQWPLRFTCTRRRLPSSRNTITLIAINHFLNIILLASESSRQRRDINYHYCTNLGVSVIVR